MKKQILAASAGLALAAAGLPAQVGGGFGSGGVGGATGRGGASTFEFQQAGTMGTATARPVAVGRTAGNASGPLHLIGRPVSATEERKSVQTLGDGTEISTSEKNLFYRDGQGRTRVEQVYQGKTVIAILDPVGMYFVDINQAAKTAQRRVIPPDSTNGGISISGGSVSNSFGGGSSNGFYQTSYVAAAAITPRAGASTADNGTSTISTSSDAVGRGGGGAVAVAGGRGGSGGGGGVFRTGTPLPNPNLKNEDLGVQSTNGVLAIGTRSTLTIQQGQIGNNRDIHIVNEKWYSEDLQMLVKSVNSDPRFGDNIYELTNISRIEPDPALFQIPADYQIIDAPTQRGTQPPARVAVPAIKQ